MAKGDEPDSAVPFLLLEVSQLLLAGGRLGAHEDIVPDERYEPDLGPEPDVDDLRERLAVLLEPVDVYSEVFDPYEPRKAPVPARISDDLADVVTDLRHGLAHYRAGRTTRGAVVVAVLVLLQLGLHRLRDPARPAVPGRPRPPEPAPGGAGRPGHGPGPRPRRPGGGGRQGHGGGDRGPAGPAHRHEAALGETAAGPRVTRRTYGTRFRVRAGAAPSSRAASSGSRGERDISRCDIAGADSGRSLD